MRFSILGISHNISCASARYVEGTARARGTFDRCVLARLPRAQIVSGHIRIEAIFHFKMAPWPIALIMSYLTETPHSKTNQPVKLCEPRLMEKCPLGRTVMSGPVRNRL